MEKACKEKLDSELYQNSPTHKMTKKFGRDMSFLFATDKRKQFREREKSFIKPQPIVTFTTPARGTLTRQNSSPTKLREAERKPVKATQRMSMQKENNNSDLLKVFECREKDQQVVVQWPQNTKVNRSRLNLHNKKTTAWASPQDSHKDLESLIDSSKQDRVDLNQPCLLPPSLFS